MYRFFVPLMVLALGCSSKKEAPSSGSAAPTAAERAAANEARGIFNSLCSTCHGQDGKGDGPASVNLNPKPRNYTDKAWQASITDAQIGETIVKGGAAMGKSPLMPAQPQLADKPEVVAELVKIVRSFGK